MQLLLGGAGRRGADDSRPHFFQFTLAFFWLLAFSSATHDIAADGFYMLALTEHEQAFFSGIRSASYRIRDHFWAGWSGGFRRDVHARHGQVGAIMVIGAPAAAREFFCSERLSPPCFPQAGTIIPVAGPSQNFFAGFSKLSNRFSRNQKWPLSCFFCYLPPRRGATRENSPPFLLDPPRRSLGLKDEQVGLNIGTAGVIAFMRGGCSAVLWLRGTD